MNDSPPSVRCRGALRHLRAVGGDPAREQADRSLGLRHCGLDVPVMSDIDGAATAREQIRLRPLVSDAHEPHFAGVKLWIEKAGSDVGLPLNFCGGLLIMRFYRLIAPACEANGDGGGKKGMLQARSRGQRQALCLRVRRRRGNVRVISRVTGTRRLSRKCVADREAARPLCGRVRVRPRSSIETASKRKIVRRCPQLVEPISAPF